MDRPAEAHRAGEVRRWTDRAGATTFRPVDPPHHACRVRPALTRLSARDRAAPRPPQEDPHGRCQVPDIVSFATCSHRLLRPPSRSSPSLGRRVTRPMCSTRCTQPAQVVPAAVRAVVCPSAKDEDSATAARPRTDPGCAATDATGRPFQWVCTRSACGTRPRASPPRSSQRCVCSAARSISSPAWEKS